MSSKKKSPQSAGKLVKSLRDSVKKKFLRKVATPDTVIESAPISGEPLASSPARSAVISVVEEIRHRAVIVGRVIDADSKAPIAQAEVKLMKRNLRIKTRRDGFFYFLDLPEGQYMLEVAAPDLGQRYVSTSITGVKVKSDAEGRPLFDVKANLALSPTRVKGQITAKSDGHALVKATVQLCGSDKWALTDGDGRYAISGLIGMKPDQNEKPTLKASAKGFVPASQKIILAAGQETVADFQLEEPLSLSSGEQETL